jgi:hypothetical protein
MKRIICLFLVVCLMVVYAAPVYSHCKGGHDTVIVPDKDKKK